MKTIKIIHNDKNIIIAEKPPGMPVQNDHTNDKSLLSQINEITGSEVYPVHRLDRPVGGIIVFAKNKKCCAYLSEQLQNKTFKKTYLAIVMGIPKKESTLIDYIIKNQRLNISKIVNKNTQGAKRAELSYKLITSLENKKFNTLSLIEINLKTGRHHQIRLQMSNAGFPIWGDTKYNDAFKRNGIYYSSGLYVNIALFSNSIQFINPETKLYEKYETSPKNLFPFTLFNP